MASTIASNLRNGQAIKWKNDVYLVLSTEHRTPGNLRAFVQATLRSINTGRSCVERLRSTESVELVNISREKWEYSYPEQDAWVFINPDTYDNLSLGKDIVGDASNYLSENTRVELLFVEGRVATLELPPTVELLITESADGIKGDSANNVMKPAVLETGLTIQVPLFVKEGDRIKVSTTEGTYLSRV
ncbi:MAG: elongation factor P [Candidatus Methylacidiphilales bacterium]